MDIKEVLSQKQSYQKQNTGGSCIQSDKGMRMKVTSDYLNNQTENQDLNKKQELL